MTWSRPVLSTLPRTKSLIHRFRVVAKNPAHSSQTLIRERWSELRIRITKHARERMKLRGISETELKLGMFRTNLTKYDAVSDSTLLQSVFPDGRVLKIWIVGRQDEVSEVIIKSAAWKGRETK